jgi:hypothetical protein
MKLLAKEISKALQKEGAYKIRSGQLTRLWPGPASQQEVDIREFAERHGWTVSVYCAGIHAVIVEKFLKTPSDSNSGS